MSAATLWRDLGPAAGLLAQRAGPGGRADRLGADPDLALDALLCALYPQRRLHDGLGAAAGHLALSLHGLAQARMALPGRVGRDPLHVYQRDGLHYRLYRLYLCGRALDPTDDVARRFATSLYHWRRADCCAGHCPARPERLHRHAARAHRGGSRSAGDAEPRVADHAWRVDLFADWHPGHHAARRDAHPARRTPQACSDLDRGIRGCYRGLGCDLRSGGRPAGVHSRSTARRACVSACFCGAAGGLGRRGCGCGRLCSGGACWRACASPLPWAA